MFMRSNVNIPSIPPNDKTIEDNNKVYLKPKLVGTKKLKPENSGRIHDFK